MRAKSVISLIDEGDRWGRERISDLLGGLEGLGTPPEGFTLRKDEESLVDDYARRHAVGTRIVNRLGSGDYQDREFLIQARAWLQSVYDALGAREGEWRSMLDGPGADQAAAYLGENDKANARRVVEALDLVDEALVLLRAHQTAGDSAFKDLRRLMA